MFGISKLRLIVYAIAIAGVVALVLKWRHDSHVLSQERSSFQIRIRELEERLAIEKENAASAREASDAYQTQLATLRAERDRIPARPVRLCDAPPVVPPAPVGPGPTRTEGLPEAPRPDYREGPDIGPELYELADEADQCAAQRDALIDWIRRTGTEQR